MCVLVSVWLMPLSASRSQSLDLFPPSSAVFSLCVSHVPCMMQLQSEVTEMRAIIRQGHKIHEEFALVQRPRAPDPEETSNSKSIPTPTATSQTSIFPSVFAQVQAESASSDPSPQSLPATLAAAAAMISAPLPSYASEKTDEMLRRIQSLLHTGRMSSAMRK